MLGAVVPLPAILNSLMRMSGQVDASGTIDSSTDATAMDDKQKSTAEGGEGWRTVQ